MLKKVKKIWLVLIIGSLFVILHSTPNLALRTHVLFMGYPKAALTSGIVEDEYHNKVEKEAYTRVNARAYTLTEPPIEKSTKGELRNYLIKKRWGLYFAEYLGEL
jgi:hypothetical protein